MPFTEKDEKMIEAQESLEFLEELYLERIKDCGMKEILVLTKQRN